jgi:hypothetical protein
MCSATQEGLRSRRSKEETRAFRVARSAIGPGKPYWKSPAGSTGGIISFPAIGRLAGTGAGREVVEVADIVVDDFAAWIFFSERVEYIAAVTPAPVAALTAAIIAIVVFDMVGGVRGVFIVFIGVNVMRRYDLDYRDIDARGG